MRLQDCAHELAALPFCEDGRNWLFSYPKETPISVIYNECNQPDWLIAAAFHLGMDRKFLFKVVCACIRKGFSQLSSKDKFQLEVIEAWAKGDVSQETALSVLLMVRDLPNSYDSSDDTDNSEISISVYNISRAMTEREDSEISLWLGLAVNWSAFGVVTPDRYKVCFAEQANFIRSLIPVEMIVSAIELCLQLNCVCN